MRKRKQKTCSCVHNSKKWDDCLKEGRKIETHIQNLTGRICINMLNLQTIPLYSKYTPTLDPLMPMEAYETIFKNDGMFFEKFLRLVGIGMMKILAELSKEDLNKVNCFQAEVYNQIVLCTQKAQEINKKTAINLR